ncbi:hypothetical protein HY408_00860 [Candidatus Gottesmanbacteria bacterium]|nr:hypothetical protein [Candidatus Gottesmanbacteria bacterium]
MREADTGLDGTQEKSVLVEEANKRLSSILTDLKGGNLSLEEKEALAEEANGLLYGAIYRYPELVYSVEVRLGMSADNNSDDIDEQYSEAHRLWYKYLVDNRRTPGEKNSLSLVAPLPYGFSTGTHGSGERVAMSASRREVYFGLTHKKGSFEATEPCLWVTVKAPLINSNETMFLPKEIEHVTLSIRTDLSPYLGRDYDKIESRGTYVDNYINFRGFENHGAGIFTTRNPRPIIVVSYRDKGLWTYDGHRRKLVKGFFILYNQINPEIKTLYEIDNQRIMDPYNASQIGALVDKILSSKRSLFHIGRPADGSTRRYTSKNIVERLAQIPVAERHF